MSATDALWRRLWARVDASATYPALSDVHRATYQALPANLRAQFAQLYFSGEDAGSALEQVVRGQR